MTEPDLPQWSPKYTEEWSPDQEALVADTMLLASQNSTLERRLASSGVQFVPWLSIKAHTDAMLAMWCENEDGTSSPTRGHEIVGDIAETKLLVFRYYYQRCIEAELVMAESQVAKATLLARPGPLPPMPGVNGR